MNRSKWKGPYTVNKELTTNNQKKQLEVKMSRNVEITPQLVDLTFSIYNGREYQEVLVTKDMINHKFGEFVFTRGKFSFKKKKKKIKWVKRLILLFFD